MKIIRYQDPAGQIHFGVRHADGSATRAEGGPVGPWKDTGAKADVKTLLAPVDPVDIMCIGLNYLSTPTRGKPYPEHPVLFMKNKGTLNHPVVPIILPKKLASTQVDYECELAVIIGKECKNATKANALSFVAGYTCANDVSARDWQITWGSQWCLAARPSTPSVHSDRVWSQLMRSLNPNALRIKTVLNGEVMQDWSTDDMIFDVPTLIEFLSGSTKLLPGTVILTGTPHGVGAARKPPVYLKSGDTVTIDIEKMVS